MRFIRLSLSFMFIICCAIGGIAQDTDQWHGTIPFRFEVANQIFPAGVYDIVVDPSSGVVNLANHFHREKSVMLLAGPSEWTTTATIKFAVNGDDCELASVTAGNFATRPVAHKTKGNQQITVAFLR